VWYVNDEGGFAGEAILGNIGGKLYVDFKDGPDLPCYGVCATHMIYRVEFVKRRLVVSTLSDSRVDSLVRQAMCDPEDTTGWQGSSVPGSKVRGPFVLTSSTHDLAELLETCAALPGSWEPVGVFKKER
jgi:hypothetical protein